MTQLFGLYKIHRLLFILLSICFFQCTTKAIRPEYYILDYNPVLRDSDSTLYIKRFFPYRVQVSTMKIPRTYDRVHMVVRFSSHRLDYYRYSLWAIRPQITISDLIAQHISVYGIFKQCQREFLEVHPDYEIVGRIEAIEKFSNKSYTAAHFAMKLYLRTWDGYTNLLSHEFDREVEMPVFRMELFAKKISDILKEEVDIFVSKLIQYFEAQKIANENKKENVFKKTEIFIDDN